MVILDGKFIASRILKHLKAETAQLQFQPLFCDILVGSDPVSLSYVKIKGRTAESAGLKFLLDQLPENISQQDLIKRIMELNQLPDLRGLIVQLPLPAHLDRQVILNSINPHWDVDCLGETNAQNFYNGSIKIVPPTAGAVMTIIDTLPEKFHSGNFVIVGQGQLVGKPLAMLLRRRNYKLTVADSKTENLSALTKTADVLISGTGHANLITAAHVKPGAAIIDAGTAEMDGGIVGDVDYEAVKDIAAFITPVPGGVGPVTVAKLLSNVVEAAKLK